MKMSVSVCFVCNRRYEPGEEYLQIEVMTSKDSFKPDPNDPDDAIFFQPFAVLVDRHETAGFVHLRREMLGSNWMRTSWACLLCVEALPPQWRGLFKRPSLDEFVEVKEIGEDKQAGTVTKLVQRVRRPGSENGGNQEEGS